MTHPSSVNYESSPILASPRRGIIKDVARPVSSFSNGVDEPCWYNRGISALSGPGCAAYQSAVHPGWSYTYYIAVNNNRAVAGYKGLFHFTCKCCILSIANC